MSDQLSGVLEVREICVLYGISRQTVYAWIRSGELPATDVARKLNSNRPKWRIRAIDLVQFFETRSDKQPSANSPAQGNSVPCDYGSLTFAPLHW